MRTLSFDDQSAFAYALATQIVTKRSTIHINALQSTNRSSTLRLSTLHFVWGKDLLHPRHTKPAELAQRFAEHSFKHGADLESSSAKHSSEHSGERGCCCRAQRRTQRRTATEHSSERDAEMALDAVSRWYKMQHATYIVEHNQIQR